MTDPIRTWQDYRDIPAQLWRWPDFSPEEIACRGTGALRLVPEALDRLQALRTRLGRPVIVRSAYRSPHHNRAVGGAARSKHMGGTAFDIAMTNHDPDRFVEAARAEGFVGIGTYPRGNYVHIDLGPPRRWGAPFPARTGRFAPEPASARERLAHSRTLQGTGVAGAATLGGAGLEIAQEALAEARGMVLPLIPYLDTLRWVFVSLALAGIALTIHARIDDWRQARR